MNSYSSFFKIKLPPLGLAAVLAAALAPATARACACGCGVFDVGTSSMFPGGSGQTLFLENDFQDQTANWAGSAKAPAADNPDKEIRTDFFTTGLQDMFSRSWGIQAELPYADRYFRTTGGAAGNQIVAFDWSGFGDLRVEGIYTGFSPDLSTGVTFGMKLPTGDYTQNDAYGDIDRDSEIGTGSTDLLFGGFHRGNLTSDTAWGWFGQVEFDQPVLERDSYRPGAELDAALGIYRHGWSIGRLAIAPMAQAKFSDRGSDSGVNATYPVGSGFDRLLLAPGIELKLHPVMVYADVELPIYQHFIGDQLAAPALYKLSVSYMF